MDLVEPSQIVKLCPVCGQQFASDQDRCPIDQCQLLTRFSEQLGGSTFAQKYRILKTIGSGGSGWVYQAMHKHYGHIVALKVLHIALIDNETAKERFRREAQALFGLKHHNIVSVHEFNITPVGQPYLATNFLDGTPLNVLLSTSGALPPQRAMKIFLQVSDALSHAHEKGIVHRDLKPNNIIIQRDSDGGDEAVIVDFGLAKLMPSFDSELQKLTSTGHVFGTPNFMSPEQWRGEHIDSRSDIYAFGALMYESLTGFPPYDIETMVAVMLDNGPAVPVAPSMRKPDLDLSAEFDAIILRALRIDKENRYQSASELQRDLFATNEYKRLQAESGSALTPAKTPSPLKSARSRWKSSQFKKYQVLIASSSLLIVVVLLAIIGSIAFSARGGVELTKFALTMSSHLPASRLVALRRHLADLDFKKGKFDAAYTEYKLLLDDYKSLLSSQNISAENRIALQLEIYQRLAEAASNVAAHKDATSSYASLALSSYEQLAAAFVRRKHLDRGIATLKEAVKFEEKFPKLLGAPLTKSLLQISLWEIESGVKSRNEQLFRDAHADFSKAIPLLQKLSETDQIDAALKCIAAGKVCFRLELWEDAKMCLNQGLRIIDNHPNLPASQKDESLMEGISDLARLYLQEKQFKKSRELWERILNFREEKGDKLKTADALFEIGNCYSFEHEQKKAEPLLRLALSLREKILGNNNFYTGLALLSLGATLIAQDKDVEAVSCLNKSIDIFRRFPDQSKIRSDLVQALRLSLTPLERMGHKAELAQRESELHALTAQDKNE